MEEDLRRERSQEERRKRLDAFFADPCADTLKRIGYEEGESRGDNCCPFQSRLRAWCHIECPFGDGYSFTEDIKIFCADIVYHRIDIDESFFNKFGAELLLFFIQLDAFHTADMEADNA